MIRELIKGKQIEDDVGSQGGRDRQGAATPYADENYGLRRSPDDKSNGRDGALSTNDRENSDGASFRPYIPNENTFRGGIDKEQAEKLYWAHVQLTMKQQTQLLYLRIFGNLLHGFK